VGHQRGRQAHFAPDEHQDGGDQRQPLLKAEDADAHDVLICIQTGTTVQDPKRMKYEPREFYLKSYEEMMGAFVDFAPMPSRTRSRSPPSATSRSRWDASRCSPLDLPPGRSAHAHMASLCREGDGRIPHASETHRERLEYELDIIEKTGFSQYS
jgi:DNA polymerase-3 subunit alpha